MTFNSESANDVEIESLRKQLAQPWRHQERRIEVINLKSVSYFEMDVTQQIRVPDLPIGSSAIVSLGLYSKTRRPSLQVFDQHGNRIPILSRKEQGKILAYLYFNVLQQQAEEEWQDVQLEEFIRLYEILRPRLESIAVSPAKTALQALESLKGHLQTLSHTDIAAAAILRAADGLNALEELAKSAQILVRIPVLPSEQIIIRHSYVQTLPYNLRSERSQWSTRSAWSDCRRSASKFVQLHLPQEYKQIPQLFCLLLKNSLRLVRNGPISILTRLLTRLGLIPTVLGRKVQNADHCDSFYLLLEAPSGTSCSRHYWEDLAITVKSDPNSESADSPNDCVDSDTATHLASENWHTDLICFAAHKMQCDPPHGKNRVYAELRPARTPSIWLAFFLALASTVAASVVAHDLIADDSQSQVFALISAIPGALTAALTRSTSESSRRITDGMVFAGFGTGALAFCMGASGLATKEATKLTAGLAIGTASASIFLAGLLFWILIVSRLFDGPNRPDSVLHKALIRIRVEKVFATLYLIGMLAAAGTMILVLT